MPNSPLTLTTTQAAGILEVHESSVKRWANEGQLNPIKTEGGHRRILLADLLAFAKKERPNNSLIRFAPFEENMAMAAIACRERNDFIPLTELIIRFCDMKPPGYLVELLRYLRKAFDIPITRVFDRGITEALRKIGREWAEGSRTIAHEHRFTQKVLDALHALRKEDADFKSSDAPLAIVGSAETCRHEIGAMFVRLALEEAGWQVCYLGADVPFDEFSGIQSELGAKLVAISFAQPSAIADAKRCMGILGRIYRPQAPYYLMLGGGGLIDEALNQDDWPFLAVKIAMNTESLQEWAKTRLQKESIKRKAKG